MDQLTKFDASISCFLIKNNITTAGFASIIKHNQRTRRVVSNAGTVQSQWTQHGTFHHFLPIHRMKKVGSAFERLWRTDLNTVHHFISP